MLISGFSEIYFSSSLLLGSGMSEPMDGYLGVMSEGSIRSRNPKTIYRSICISSHSRMSVDSYQPRMPIAHISETSGSMSSTMRINTSGWSSVEASSLRWRFMRNNLRTSLSSRRLSISYSQNSSASSSQDDSMLSL